MEKHEQIKQVLFVDFNGVISYKPFWMSLQNPNHALASHFEIIENLLFKSDSKIQGLVDDWMIGKYSSEQIHQIISDRTGIPFDELFNVFQSDCKELDISTKILAEIKKLKREWYCILVTDNMDSFIRFTLPAKPQLAETFDELHCSCELHQLKKTNNGKFFRDTLKKLRVNFKKSVLIDDSEINCQMFRKLGGQVFRTENEAQVIETLSRLDKEEKKVA